jgi:hypothetical protein
MKLVAKISLVYIVLSVFYGPFSLLIGNAQTSGGGDVLDSSYRRSDGSFDYGLRDAEFNRAENTTLVLAGIGIIAGLINVVLLLFAYRKKHIDIASLAVHLSLTVFMMLGYLLAITIMRFP